MVDVVQQPHDGILVDLAARFDRGQGPMTVAALLPPDASEEQGTVMCRILADLAEDGAIEVIGVLDQTGLPTGVTEVTPKGRRRVARIQARG